MERLRTEEVTTVLEVAVVAVLLLAQLVLYLRDLMLLLSEMVEHLTPHIRRVELEEVEERPHLHPEHHMR